MLVLSRKQHQEVLIGDSIKITILKVRGNTVRLGIEAPRDVRIVRGELSLPDEVSELVAGDLTDDGEAVSLEELDQTTIEFRTDRQSGTAITQSIQDANDHVTELRVVSDESDTALPTSDNQRTSDSVSGGMMSRTSPLRNRVLDVMGTPTTLLES